jgi:nucleoside-diphosphate-sugar epimerase
MSPKKAFFVTGATGQLGGYITAALLRRGERVITAVRPGRGKRPEQRIEDLLHYFKLDPKGQVETVEAWIDRPGLGLSPENIKRLRDEIGPVFHCAADTSFAERKRTQVARTNVGGLNNVFDVVCSSCTRFYYMSTAYAAGVRQGVCKETLEENDTFHNGYEHSKYLAEREIVRRCSQESIPLTLFRPSIVYGEHESGRSLRYTALYYPVRVLLFLRESLVKDIRKKDGRWAQEMGVKLNGGDRMVMPLSMIDTGGYINLIPIDYCVDSIMAILRSGQQGVFHIVNDKKNTLGQLVDFFTRAYDISGIQTVAGARSASSTPLETLFDDYIKSYRPYLCDTREFDNRRAKPVLAKAGIHCPEMDYTTFKRCMDYAREDEWGSRNRI